MRQPFVTAARAMGVARAYILSLLQLPDPMLAPWHEATLNTPVLVRTVQHAPSYWIVPMERSGRVLGTIDVGPDGNVMGYVYFYQRPDDLSACPSVATRISAQEAVHEAEELLQAYGDLEHQDPVYVHDGPHNRLAWMIEVHRQGELVTRVFVTPGYAYERKAEQTPPPPGWRG